MVQLSPSPSPARDVSPPPEEQQQQEEEENQDEEEDQDLMKALEVSTSYHGYDSYIEDGLICLKHKVRNLEKKKMKLEEYKKKMNQGQNLNRDQMAAVEKYDEVLHNLDFAGVLHRTLDVLTQNLLRAQKKALKKEQVEKVEAERRRLTTVLQVQHLLSSLQQEHVRRDLLAGQNRAPHFTAQQLNSLRQLAALLAVQRDSRLSLEQQMEQAALVYLDLLEGAKKPVAGSTFKQLMEDLSRLLNCQYFACLPPPPTKTAQVTGSSTGSTKLKSKPKEVSKEFFNRLYLTGTEALPTQSWKEDLVALKEQEPPDCWDTDFPDGPSSKTTGHKPWRGAAPFIPKEVPVSSRKRSADVPRKERKARGKRSCKSAAHMDMPVEMFSSLSSLLKDPILRRQQLEDLMTTIHGSFSFMQDSLLDGDSPSTNGIPRLKRRPSGSPSPLAAPAGLRSPADVLPKVMHSTPLPSRRMERRASLTNGDPCLQTCDLEVSSKDLPREPLQLAERKMFPSPPLYRRESSISVSLEEKSRPRTPVTDSGKQSPYNGVASCTSTPPQGQTFSTPPTRQSLTSAQYQNIQSVFKVNPSLSPSGELKYKADSAVFSETNYSTASTQTPPEFAPSEDEQQPVSPSHYTGDTGGQIFLSPGQSGGNRPGQPYYSRGSVRGGFYIPPVHLRDSGPVLYAARDSGYQHGYRRGGRHNSSAAWRDSSLVSSPDRDGAFTIVDSGHDSLSVSTLETPLTPHSHHLPPTLLPMQLYPLSQPLRVAFTAARTANFAPGNLDQPIVFDHLHSNLGEMYDTHIGRFTCPANGTYCFIFHIMKLAINVPLYINLMRNEDVMVSAYANDGAPDHETASNHAVLPLFQGDQVWLRLHRGAIYGSTWNYSTFSGFLLYQD
ncbi:caprin-2 isoform X2 [Brachyistius frenatus]|uniref:caprin-2 isoform X2 n=1 Tax=Brachyistius frenatus TaxID=100188 RepID=UPI0037E713F7